MTSIRLPYVQEYRDRHGKVRRYFRRPGFKRVALPGTPGSPQFMAAYEAALSAERLPIGRKHKDGTIGDLVVSFYRSAYFENLKPRSQRVYRLVLDKFAQEDGHRLVRDMPRRVAMNIIEEIGATRPGMANLTLKAMRRLFAYAIKKEMRDDNPFVGIESYKLGTHHTWTDAEIAAYEAVWPIETRERLAFDLLLYTGQRVGDVAAMRRSDIRNGAIHLTPEKTGDDLVVPQVIPLHPKSAAFNEGVPRKGADSHRAGERPSDQWGGAVLNYRARGKDSRSSRQVRPTRAPKGSYAAPRRAWSNHQGDRVGIRPQDAQGGRALHRWQQIRRDWRVPQWREKNKMARTTV